MEFFQFYDTMAFFCVNKFAIHLIQQVIELCLHEQFRQAFYFSPPQGVLFYEDIPLYQKQGSFISL